MAFVGTRRALLGGSSLPRWAAGFDLWYNYQVPQGSYALAFPPATDTHSSTINALTPAGTYQSFAANVPVRTGLGLQTVPTRTNLFLNSFAPVTQTITISNTTQYTVSMTGTGSLTLSGGGTGTVTASAPVTFTSSSTSLTVTVSGSPSTVNVTTGAFAVPPIQTAGTSATVVGNQQVIDLTGKLATGASGFMQVSIQNPSGGAFDPYVFDISDGTANNRLNVRNNSTNFRVSAAAGGVSQAAFNAAAWQTGIVTLAFAISTNYVNVRIVGQADPGAVTSATYPTGMTIFTVGGLGTGTGSNIFQYTRKLALKFGPQNASTFAAAFAAAQLAAVSP